MPAATMPILRDEAPLIVTAWLDEASFARLDALRRRHFPAGRNQVPAHVSLFHHLPGAELPFVHATIAAACRSHDCFLLRPAAPLFLGRGVAIRYDSADLTRLRDELARAWTPWLTAQDRQPFRPHVTIQNKVTPTAARALFDAIGIDTAPTCRVEGVTLWRYLDGPWERLATCPFGRVADES